ncbi:unnamed protein product [Clavelina lepadiformis]|uniref:C-type lectin domain-containing protein n=1 Tax=Clavelina lepadiformis TaxID=159417 RepID=A0ABP0GUR9_CLALP
MEMFLIKSFLDAQHYNRSGFPISYDSASKFCGARNMRLCSKKEIIPFGNTPIITGATGKDHWSPISDRYNDWLQVGGIQNRLGRSHIDLYGAPYWGLIAHSRTSLKDHLYCCRERLTAFPPASCAGVDERGNGSYVISPKPDDVLPFSVKCAFGTITETIIEHHMMEETMMTSCAAACYTPVLNYQASIEQIISLMNRSVECRQFIKYRCRGAMLLRDLRSSWISRDGEKMKYWGGATSRRTGYCACGETGTCVNNAYKCNCDINQNKLETSDEGYLNDTSALPVKRLKVGDTDYSLEAAWYTVGPLICTEDEPTTINHDSMNEIEVTPCSGRKCFKRVINYDITIEEVGALIDQSFECKQFIKYRCIASKFLEGYASWLSRNGSEMTFWGGSTSQRPYYCACGETGSCLNNNWKCNCDANLNVETFDEGYLTDKTLLPVTEVRFGDTDSPTESGWFTLGPLVCNGRVQQGEPEVGWYAPSNGYQYILISTTQSWFESRQTCQEMGGDLAVAGAQDLTMRRKIVDQLSIPGLSGAWIGMTDMDEEGTWLWLNGVAVSNPHWYTTEPNGLANENCAILSYSNLSKDYALDVNCEAALFRGICEKRIF